MVVAVPGTAAPMQLRTGAPTPTPGGDDCRDNKPPRFGTGPLRTGTTETALS